ncbi:MAG: prolipoprotein diacylglyceryl transferase [Erysipelotrichaceae bacterium]
MALFPDIQTFIQLGPLRITWYAIFILSAAFLTYYLCLKTFRKWGYKDEVFENFFIMMLPIAIIGARLWYVIFEWERYRYDLIKIFFTWEGGLAIHGGIIAAILFGCYYFKKKSINGLRVADVVFSNLLIAQAIGRWGNFMNQEAFGGIVSESFYQYFPSFIKNQMFIEGAYRQPTFLYESIGSLIGFVLIKYVFRKYGYKKRGDMMFAYFTWYGTIRLFVEGFRSDSLMFAGIRVAQLISILSILIGLLGLFGVWDKLLSKIYPFKKKKPVVIFDLDGTLLDTESLIFASFHHTFKQYKPDYELSEAECKSFLGPTLKQSFDRYFDPSMSDELIKCYREYNHIHHNEYVKAFPKAKETLTYLKENGYDLAIVSNKTKETVSYGLDFCELNDFFEVIIGCEDIKNTKPDPEGIMKACKDLYRGIDDVIYVGDSTSDIEAAKNMGAYSIAVSFDQSNLENLKATKPCRIINELSDVIDIVKEEQEWSDVTIY